MALPRPKPAPKEVAEGARSTAARRSAWMRPHSPRALDSPAMAPARTDDASPKNAPANSSCGACAGNGGGGGGECGGFGGGDDGQGWCWWRVVGWCHCVGSGDVGAEAWELPGRRTGDADKSPSRTRVVTTAPGRAGRPLALCCACCPECCECCPECCPECPGCCSGESGESGPWSDDARRPTAGRGSANSGTVAGPEAGARSKLPSRTSADRSTGDGAGRGERLRGDGAPPTPPPVVPPVMPPVRDGGAVCARTAGADRRCRTQPAG